MPRTLPTKAARKQAFELKSAQLEVEIAHAGWQALYLRSTNMFLSPRNLRDEQATHWQLHQAQLHHELAALKLAYIAEEARIATLKSAARSRGAA